jgi:predicted dehydrogenase
MGTEKKRALVVGAGSIGERHIRCFLATERVEVCFVEPFDKKRTEIAARYPAAIAFDSLQPALQDGVDVAVIATPAPSHIELARNLVEKNIHLLIEKPLGVSTQGTLELEQEVTRRRLVASVAYVYRSHPVLAAMQHAIAEGRFGPPVELVAVSGQHFPFYRPAYRETYYTRRETGGGAVQDALTHVVNAGQWLVGGIVRLVGDIDHKVLADVEVEDTAHVLARHGQVMASYSLNQHQAPNELTLTVICERGTARFENHNCRWLSMESPGGTWTEHDAGTLERDDIFIRQANGFLDAVEGRAQPLCTLAEGLMTLKANLAILRSAEQRRWVDLADI